MTKVFFKVQPNKWKLTLKLSLINPLSCNLFLSMLSCLNVVQQKSSNKRKSIKSFFLFVCWKMFLLRFPLFQQFAIYFNTLWIFQFTLVYNYLSILKIEKWRKTINWYFSVPKKQTKNYKADKIDNMIGLLNATFMLEKSLSRFHWLVWLKVITLKQIRSQPFFTSETRFFFWIPVKDTCF